MSVRILNRSFSGGEITPELFGRLDLSKVQEALALCMNFITLPHGPVVNRPGTEYVEEVKDSASATRLIPFSYNNTQTFAIQLGAGYFRFHTQGGTLQCGSLPSYVPPATVAISLGAPGVVGWPGHGLAADTPVSFSTTGALPPGITAGVTYYVANPATDTFQLATAPKGGAISTANAATVSIGIAAPGVVTWNSHGLAAGTGVVFSTTGALPTGITAGTTYYVVAPTPNTFEIAATPGGAAITTSGTQSGAQTCTASATVTISIATPGVITWNNHGLAAGAAVAFSTSGALPTGISAGTTYYVVNPTINTFEIAAAPGGAAIATSGTQSGTQTCAGRQVGTHTASYAYDLGSALSYANTNYYCLAPSAGQNPVQPAWSAVTAYAPGDLVSYNGFTFVCTAGSTNVVPAYGIPAGGSWQAIWYAMPAGGDYEIPNVYAAADLMDIHYTQSADVLTLVHPNYPIMELRRYGATTWELVKVNFAAGVDAPVGTNSAGSPTSHQYVVTAQVRTTRRQGRAHVSYGYETLPSLASAAVYCDLTQYGAYISLSWSPVAIASSTNLNPVISSAGYNAYKLIGGVYQYLGSASGTSFTDTYAVSAAAKAGRNPPTAAYVPGIAPGQPVATPYGATLGTLNVIATGSGSTSYSYVVTALDAGGNESYPSTAATCTNDLTTGTNHNTINWPGVENASRYNVYKLSYGIYGFIGQVAPPSQAGAPAMSFVDNNITPDISRTPPMRDANQLDSAGDYPAAVAYYQQRRIFAGTLNQPQNVWATRSGTESDMSYTIPTRDDNRIAFRVAGREASAIRHIVPMQDLLFLSASCEWRCSSTTGVLTPGTISVQPQSYIGANNVQPVVVGNAVLYAAARGGHIRQMNYNWQINGYQSTDSSIFAPHLFDYNTIVDMAYARGPIPILWCVSSTGSLLGMTYLPEQEIAAWHQHATGAADAFESICTITENNEDMLYCIVRRTMSGGVTKRFVERLHTRLYSSVADCHYVDCGATFNVATAKAGAFARAGTTMTCTIAGHGFATGETRWFYFSDTSFGAGPVGKDYAVTVVDAKTFTIAVANAGAVAGSVTCVSSGTFTRSGANMTCTMTGHGFSSGDTGWFYFSDGGFGALPTGQGYVVTYVNANTFTITVPEPSAPVAISIGSPAVISWNAHGLASGAPVVFSPNIGTFARSGTTMTCSITAHGLVNGQTYSFYFSDTGFGAPPGGTSYPVTVVDANTFTITVANAGAVSGTVSHPALPAGLTAGTTYYVVNPAANTFQIAASPGGAAIATSGTAAGTQICTGDAGAANGTLTHLPHIVSNLTWLEGMTVNVLADGAVLPPQTVSTAAVGNVPAGSITLPVGATQVHVGLPITAQLQTPPAAQSMEPALAQGLAKNVNKVFLRTYRSSGILAGPDFADLTPYRQRTVENPGSPPNMVSDEVEILLSNDWGTSGQICIQQSDPLPLDIASMTLEIAVGGGV